MKNLYFFLLFSFLFSQGFWTFNNRTHSELKWYTKKTQHFNIHYHPEIEEIALKGATIAEQSIAALMNQMDLKTIPILDIIFTNEDEIMNGYAMYTNQTFIWVDQNDAAVWLEDEKWLKQVLTHELQHLVFMNAIRTWLPEPWSMTLIGQIPSWFIEGLAEYYTEKWRPYRADISHKFHILTNTIDNMNPHHDGYSKILYLSERFGNETIVKIINYRNNFNLIIFKDAFKKATGISVKRFEEDWRKTMNTYYYGYRAQKEDIDELGNTASLPVKKVSTFLISSDSSQIAIVGTNDLDQLDNSFIIASKKEKMIANKYFNLLDIFNSKKKTEKEKWIKPEFKKKEVDFGRFHTHLSWSSNSNKIAYSKYHRGNNGSMIWDIKIFDIKSQKSKWITYNMRATYPTWLNNDNDLLFIAHYNSTAQIYNYNFQSEKITQLTKNRGDISIFSPAISPDQKSLVYAMAPEDGNTDLYLMDLKSKKNKRLTQHPFVDYLPVWNPKGDKIAFTSHRNSVPNIYTLDIKSKSITQITDVGDAVWSHQWNPKDSTLILKTLHDTDTTRLVLLDLNRKIDTKNLEIRNRYSSWITQEPNIKINNIDFTNYPKILNTRKYSFYRHIKHFTSTLIPIPIPVATTTWIDALGKHLINANIGNYDYNLNSTFGGVSYSNATMKSFWGFSYNYNQDFKFREYDSSSNGLTESRNGLTLWTRTPFNSGESLSSNHTFHTSIYFGDLNTYQLYDYIDSTLNNGQDTVIATEHIAKFLPNPQSGKLGKLSFKYHFLSKRNHKQNYYLPPHGFGINFKLDIAHKKLNSDFNYSQVLIDFFNNYKIRSSIIYSRIKAVAQFGEPPAQDELYFHTDEAQYLPIIGISENLPEIHNLRGSEQFRIGNKLILGTLEIRNKILDRDLTINILGFTIGNISSAIISDFGNIWQNSQSTGHLIATLGTELKFSFKSCGFPVMTFAYGYANEVNNIKNGAELKHYYRLALINPF